MNVVSTGWTAFEAEVVAAREAGATYEELKARFGLTKHGLRNMLRKYGLAGSPQVRSPVPLEVQERMVELRAAGLSRRKVAALTGWSAGAVDRAVERRERGRSG